MRRIGIFALVLLAGCSSMQWDRPDVSAEQLRADEEECRQAAWREAQVRTWHYHSFSGPVFARDAFGRGFMMWPGRTMAVDPYPYQHLEESRLSQFCMEAKGYRLVPAPAK